MVRISTERRENLFLKKLPLYTLAEFDPTTQNSAGGGDATRRRRQGTRKPFFEVTPYRVWPNLLLPFYIEVFCTCVGEVWMTFDQSYAIYAGWK
jgi:hypothetical protein